MTAYEMRISDWSADVCSSDLSSPDRPDDVAGIDADGFPVGSHRSLVLLPADVGSVGSIGFDRSEEHTSELQSLMRSSYAVFCLKKKKLHHSQILYHSPQ